MSDDEDPHGTLTWYTGHRCRCEECRAVNAAYQAAKVQQRARLLAVGLITVKHGTENAYGNYGCRCEECRDARAATSRRYRAARKARKRQP